MVPYAPRKGLVSLFLGPCIQATMDREIRRDPERDVGYGITDSWDEIDTTLQAPYSTNTTIGMDRLNMLFRDRRALARIARLVETEARISREAWGRFMDASDLARVEVMSLRTTETEAAHIGPEAEKRTLDQMAEFERQPGPATGPAQPELTEEAGSQFLYTVMAIVFLTVGNDIAYVLTWTELKKKITDKYSANDRDKKLEVEQWELKVKELM
ncbi:hypothetical protein Tco_1304417 [Tanacetum coccineum]